MNKCLGNEIQNMYACLLAQCLKHQNDITSIVGNFLWKCNCLCLHPNCSEFYLCNNFLSSGNPKTPWTWLLGVGLEETNKRPNVTETRQKVVSHFLFWVDLWSTWNPYLRHVLLIAFADAEFANLRVRKTRVILVWRCATQGLLDNIPGECRPDYQIFW